jgi:hypothetical protein
MNEKKEKVLKSPGERVLSKLSDIVSSLSILENELLTLKPEEFVKFQALKKAKTNNGEILSPLQLRLIKIIKEGDDEFVKAVFNVASSFLLLKKNNTPNTTPEKNG